MELKEVNADTETKKEKRHECFVPGCKRAFEFKSQLERHIVAHSNYKPYKCPAIDCGKPFKRLDALVIHMKNDPHPETGPWKCGVPGCGNLSSTACEQITHFKKKHRKIFVHLNVDSFQKFFELVPEKKIVENDELIIKLRLQQIKDRSAGTSIDTIPVTNHTQQSSPTCIDTLRTMEQFSNMEDINFPVPGVNEIVNSHQTTEIRSTESMSRDAFEQIKSLLPATQLGQASAKTLEDFISMITRENRELKARLRDTEVTTTDNVLEYGTEEIIDNPSPLCSVSSFKTGRDIWDFNKDFF